MHFRCDGSYPYDRQGSATSRAHEQGHENPLLGRLDFPQRVHSIWRTRKFCVQRPSSQATAVFAAR
jgi:hypothetical protein